MTAILIFCQPNTSTCFGCRMSLQEGNDLCFVTKSRRPTGRDDNGIMRRTTDLKNVYMFTFIFQTTQDLKRIIVSGTKQLLIVIRYLFLTMKQILFFPKFSE